MDLFIDRARIQIEAGKGGNGCVAFRREKYVEFGGPNGGDGGNGGDVFIQGNKGLQTLAPFRDRYHFRAQKGSNGEGKNRYGKGGEDLILEVPLGTVVYDELTGRIIADVVSEDKILLALGGKGGKGNTHFKSSINRAPEIAEPGIQGQVKQLVLELKLLADVGLIGFPNAGKSTIITKVSNSHSQVAAYPFSTLRPYLGVVHISDWQHFLMADIPGIIEKAHQGKGIGLKFLKHIERSKIHLFVIDLFSENPAETFQILKKELACYNSQLLDFPYLVALNKADGFLSEDWPQVKKEFMNQTQVPEDKIFVVSAIQKETLQPLMTQLFELVKTTKYHPALPKEGLDLEQEKQLESLQKFEKPSFQEKEDDITFFWERSPGHVFQENPKFSKKLKEQK